jgi:hypothetical protein
MPASNLSLQGNQVMSGVADTKRTKLPLHDPETSAETYDQAVRLFSCTVVISNHKLRAFSSPIEPSKLQFWELAIEL